MKAHIPKKAAITSPVIFFMIVYYTCVEERLQEGFWGGTKSQKKSLKILLRGGFVPDALEEHECALWIPR